MTSPVPPPRIIPTRTPRVPVPPDARRHVNLHMVPLRELPAADRARMHHPRILRPRSLVRNVARRDSRRDDDAADGREAASVSCVPVCSLRGRLPVDSGFYLGLGARDWWGWCGVRCGGVAVLYRVSRNVGI